MVFDNDDDFGIKVFREDIWESVASKNIIIVGLIKRSDSKSEDLQGDFLGIQTNNYQEEIRDIKININSYNPQALKLKKQGYEARGELKFSCVARYNVDVKGDDLIVFFSDYVNGLKAGQVFKIEMGDAGLYQGQYCWKEFDIILIREDGWEYKGEKLTNDIETQTDIVDALTEADYTVASWAILETAYNLPFRTNPQGYVKLAALESGIDGLVFANLGELNILLNDIALLSEGDYTEESWAILVLALALSQTTNPLIIIKIAALESAVSGLVEV